MNYSMILDGQSFTMEEWACTKEFVTSWVSYFLSHAGNSEIKFVYHGMQSEYACAQLGSYDM